MSRHMLTAHDAAHEVVVGWDRPLNTFFAQVINTAADEESDDRTILWIGGEHGEARDPAAIVSAVGPFAQVPYGLEERLEDDRRERPPQRR